MTSVPEIRDSEARRRTRRETLAATCVLLVELLVFFWTPISRYRDVYYSSADLTQAFSLTRIEPGHQPGNQLQSDAVTQMQPWLMFARDELRAGRFPLWNPLNGAGCPHFANYQSAVLSPFSVPFYVLDFKAALLVSAAAKLFLLGLFTYLFLRRIGCGWIGAVVGASAFTFAGHNALLLYFPHVGALVALPAGLYFAEVVLDRASQAITAGTLPRLAWPLAGLCAAFVTGLLAGNPEPFYFAAVTVAVWCATRVVQLLREHRTARRAVLTTGAKLVCAVAIAGGIAAIQLVPFFEYLHTSRVLEQRGFRQTPLEPRWWPLALFPNVLGTPAGPYKISDQVPPPNYELVNMAYVGGAALFLAALCPFLARGRRGGWFFPLFGVAWLFYAYDFFGAYDLFRLVPTLGLAPINRSQGVWNFAVAAAAALAVDALVDRARGHAWMPTVWSLVGGAVFLVTCLLGADRLIEEFATFPSPNHDKFASFVPEHLAFTSFVFGATVLLAAGALLVPRGKVRMVLCAVLVLPIGAQSAWLFHDYNPVCEDRFFFPVTPAIRTLQSQVGRERLALLGEDCIPPASNMAYGIDLVASYDGMWVRDLDYLYRDRFGDGNNWRPILHGTKNALRVFGVKYLLAKWGWSFLDDGIWEFPKAKDQVPIRLDVVPERDVVQTFRGHEEGLSAVMVFLSTPPRVRDCTVRFVLTETSTGRVVCDESLSSRDVQAGIYAKHEVQWPSEYKLDPHGRPVVFRFPREKGSLGREYRITLSSADGAPNDTVMAWCMPLLGYGEGKSRHGTRDLPGELIFDWSYDSPTDLAEAAHVDDWVLYELPNAPSKYSLVGGAFVADTQDAALEMVRSPSFEPRRLVVLEAAQKRDVDAVLADPIYDTQRRVVQFSDSPYVYLVAGTGHFLVHIDDEATFLANKLEWKQIEKLPASDRAKFTLIPDTDRARKKALGLRLIDPPTSDDAAPTIVEELPGRVRLKVSRRQPGYLVAANTFYPGWKARLNGADAPLYRANYAFQAVEIPPGTWDVELSFEPSSFRIGAAIAAACALFGVVALVVGLRAERARAVAA